ncbi:MAG: HPr(Ser) kinase/phosphatase [Gammaproteobacteria bacterium]|nr:HPr(Ser) kinase/phosphatase [Gammaproteobacteria bacterium]
MTKTQLTAGSVYLHHEQRLGLQWVSGQAGADRPLFADSVSESASEVARGALVGHMNLIYPNRIQVLGRVEQDYLSRLGKNSRSDALTLLFGAVPAMIIVSDGETVGRDLIDYADRSGTPLFQSSLSTAQLITFLQYALSEAVADTTFVHGVFMEILGIGVLLTGESGIGKSELALELISRNHRLVADDAPEFHRVAPDILRGVCPGVLRGYLEVRGLGVLNIRAMFGDSAIKTAKRLSLVIHLQRMSGEELAKVDRLWGSRQKRVIQDVEIDQITIPVAPGHNMAVLAEGAVRNHILLDKGYDAVQHFIDRQAKTLKGDSV